MDKVIGKVTHYYNRLSVAVLELTDELKIGDTVLILGYTTDLQQQVTSLEINHKKVQTAGPGMEVAMLVGERVRAGDTLYKVTGA